MVLAMPPPIERVDLCEQAAEQVEFGRHLGPDDDRRERTDRDLQSFASASSSSLASEPQFPKWNRKNHFAADVPSRTVGWPSTTSLAIFSRFQSRRPGRQISFQDAKLCFAGA